MTKIVRQETREATTLDAMRAHVLEGRKLSDKLQKRFDQLDELWKLILGNGRSFGVKLFAKRHGINVTSTYPIVRQAMQLFGDVLTNDQAGERQIIADRLDKIWREAMKKNDFAAANKALENKMKLLKLDTDADGPAPRPLPTVVVFTTNPAALHQKEVQDIPYES